MNKILSETHQVCSNYAPWADDVRVPGVTCLKKGLYREKYEKFFFLSETIRPRALMFGM